MHSSLVLPLTMQLWIINTSSAAGGANQSGLRGTFSVPAVFRKPCRVFNASCDIVDGGSYWNTNFSLQEPNQTGVPGGGGHVVRVRGNWLPCPAGGFRLKALLHMQSFGELIDEFCIGSCCRAHHHHHRRRAAKADDNAALKPVRCHDIAAVWVAFF